MKIGRETTVLKRLICFLGMLFAAALAAAIYAGNGWSPLRMTLFFLAAAVLLALLVFRVLPQLPHWAYLVTAGLLCVGLRLLAVAVLPVDTLPSHDFAAYFRLAQTLAEHGTVPSSSANLFPHILFYSLVLSLPFRLFGSTILTYQLCGVALALGQILLLYAILLGFLGRRGAFFGCLLWACDPVLILYAPLNCNEHLALTLILLYLFLLFFMERHPALSVPGLLLQGVALGLNLLALNLIRPMAVILAVATLLYLGLRHPKAIRRNWLAACAGLLAAAVVLMGGKSLVFWAADGILPQPLSPNSAVFTLLVGSNFDAGGSWNAPDSKLFLDTVKATYNDGCDYQKAYREIMDVVENRYRAMSPQQIGQLLLVKNETLWGGQRAVVAYLTQYREEALPSLLDHPRAVNLMRESCDSAMLALLILLAAACLPELRRKNGTPVLWCAITVMGLACLYCLTEAAGRYTLMAYPMLTVCAAALGSDLFGRKELNR